MQLTVYISLQIFERIEVFKITYFCENIKYKITNKFRDLPRHELRLM